MKWKISFGVILLLTILLFIIQFVLSGKNNIINPDFEKKVNLYIEGEVWKELKWKVNNNYNSQLVVDSTVFHSGNSSLRITNSEANDTRIVQEIKVKGNSYYRLSCWIMTENVGVDQKGANLSIDGITNTSLDIKGTSNQWQYVEMIGKTAKTQESIKFTMGIGGYGSLNTGTAWFDDASVVKIWKVPSGVQVIPLFADQQVEGIISGNSISFMNIYTLFFLLILFAAYYIIVKKNINVLTSNEKNVVIGILIYAVLIKIGLAMTVEGYSTDIACFKSWADSAAQNLSKFYSSVSFCDYPPLYIYVLGFIGKLSDLIGADYHSSTYLVLIKLPSIIADSVTAYLLYKLAKSYQFKQMGILIAVLYSLNPAIIMNSTLWGQVDSLFTLILVGALLLLKQEKLKLSTLLFALAVLMKPQGIIFLPILFFELLKRKRVKNFVEAFIVGISAVIVVAFPFALDQGVFWIFKLYLNTAQGYTYASMNAFNFFSLMGANGREDALPFFLLSYSTWGFIFIILTTVFVGFLYYRSKSDWLAPYASLIIITGVFMFSSRMHERYLFPAIALLTMTYFHFKDKRLLTVLLGFTLTSYLNLYAILNMTLTKNYSWFGPKDMVLLIGSLINILLYFYLLFITYQLLISENKKSGDMSLEADLQNDFQVIKKRDKTEELLENDVIIAPVNTKMSQNDWKIMLAMTVIYAILAFFSLGSRIAPVNGWVSQQVGQTFIVEFSKVEQLDRISFYGLLGSDRESTTELSVEYLDAENRFQPLGEIVKDTVFHWKHLDAKVETTQLRFTVNKAGGDIGEMGFYNAKKQEINQFRLVNTDNIPNLKNLFDEKAMMEYKSSYKNSTYFDEVYFPRTAYEFIHNIIPYENTHPPLGKDIIALGIKLFGLNTFGWRFFGTLFGVLMVPVMYLFGKKIFGKTFLAFSLAFLMMFDFMHFTQTRIATIDSFATLFIILMYLFMYQYYMMDKDTSSKKSILFTLFCCGIFFGLGIATKWIAVYGGAGLATLFFAERFQRYRKISEVKTSEDHDRLQIKKYWRSTIQLMLICIVFFVVIPLSIYCLSYIPYMTYQHGITEFIKEIIANQENMYSYHSGLKSTHPFASPWWQWPIILRPTWFYLGQELASGRYATIATMGNPAIWWVGILTFFASLWISIKRKDRKMAVIFIAIAFQYVPWVLVSRVTYIYHYFSTTPFIMITIVYMIQYQLEKKPNKKKWIGIYLLIVLLLFIAFYPVLSGMEVNSVYIESLKWFESWDF